MTSDESLHDLFFYILFEQDAKAKESDPFLLVCKEKALLVLWEMTLLLVLKSTLRITLFQQALFSETTFQKEVVEENNEIRQEQTT